mgnify:CR=1 FL=1
MPDSAAALTRRAPKLRRTFKPSESDKDFTPASRTQFEIHKAIDTGDEETAMWELGKAGNLGSNEILAGVTLVARKIRWDVRDGVAHAFDGGAIPVDV